MPDSIPTLLARGAAAMGLPLDAALADQLTRYALELRKWSRSMNLVGKATDETLAETHFLDSLTLLPALRQDPAARDLLDVGSGAGFPGLVIKAAWPELPVTLVEPRQKRVVFLKHIIRTLALAGVTVEASRLEAAGDRPAGPFDAITCRAFGSIRDFLPLVRRVTRPGSRVLFMKGPAGDEEARLWQRDEGGQSFFAFTGAHAWRLPFSGAERRILVFTRIAEDSEKT